MARKKQVTKNWNRIAGEPAGTKGLVDDFLFPQGQGRDHGEHQEHLHRSTGRANERTQGAA